MTAILVTRPQAERDPVVGLLQERGYRVHAVPTVATVPIKIGLPDLERYDWIVVTSATGVLALPSVPAGPRWAAVGPGTAAELEARGVTPDVVPEQSNGLALADAIPDVTGKTVLLARADAAGSDLPQRLRERGAVVDEVAVYRTVIGPAGSAGLFASALGDPSLAAVIFASGSAVQGYLRLGGRRDIPAVTIGPRTTAAARAAGLSVLAEAAAQDPEALAAAVAVAIPIPHEEQEHA
ncbi:MAG: uroporphyrinogen-III synthase [Chloroflexi bacterium]|nr:MAG: uroporphyrinogen-III synthase [Chloroflexota bacterium]TME15193.1 MAG: uroporphyrinogen-III synthase [Chloroflexota bacterium]TME15419.1 MAG: uroporphyrinogen-III synthase [Chloroflexota bacterium]